MRGLDGLSPVEGLDVHETEDGLIVFNKATDRVHHLNHTAAAVFVLCDGSRTAGEVAQAVADLFALDAPPDQAVQKALEDLVAEGLLVTRAAESA